MGKSSIFGQGQYPNWKKNVRVLAEGQCLVESWPVSAFTFWHFTQNSPTLAAQSCNFTQNQFFHHSTVPQ
jgi:hypothetical protein